MNDGLAEQLFNAFWDPLVERGWPKPSPWADLHPTQREAWEQVAVAARAEFAKRDAGEIQMLRDANAAWQREAQILRDANGELRAQLAETNARSAPELLTDAEVSRLFSIKPGTLKALRARGQIPYIRIGGRIIRYRRAELDAWIAERSVPHGARKAT